MYAVKTEKFEGPLDLLLELIENEKLEITEVSLSTITDRYLKEVSSLDPKVYDVAEFLVVAGKLIYLKSKAILPTLATEEEEEEIEDLRARLEEYKKYRDAAREFGNILKKNQRSFSPRKPITKIKSFTPPQGVNLTDLLSIFNRLVKDMPEELKREEIALPSEKITVEEKLADLEVCFKKSKKQRFSHILKSSKTKLEAIVTFLAILEMVKCKKIRFTQGKNFSDIELTWI
jgi:segregation and condensation protein A